MKDFFRAGMFILLDLLSSLAFAGIFALTNSVFVATGVGIGLGVLQIVWRLSRGQVVDSMMWLSLGMVLVFGAATLLTHNPVFIKIKPVIVYLVVGAAMLQPGWMNRYMPPIVMERGADLVLFFGFIWAGLMFVTAAAIAVLAFFYSIKAYAAFLAVFPLSSKLALFTLQYWITRILVRRRIAAGQAAQGAPALDSIGPAPDVASS